LYTETKARQEPEFPFTISARGKTPATPVFRFLRDHFGHLPLDRIESLFGFVEKSTLYGGRVFGKRELSVRDVAQLNNAGIGIRLPFSNHQVSREEYELNRGMIAKYHHTLNSVIVTNDDLARWIGEDYPDYRIDASVIKNINNTRKLEKALKIYDEVVLPMTSNEDTPFLKSIEEPQRITLFANAGCAFTCPSKTCYASVSEINKDDPEARFQCSQSIKERELLGMLDFELEPLVEMGFRSFKLLRSRPGGKTGF